MPNLDKYSWVNRVLLLETPNYKNKDYLSAKKLYEDNIKEFHKRYIKLVVHRDKTLPFKIKLIGFDSQIKHSFDYLEPSTIFNLVDEMPLGKLMKSNPKIKPKNLSLFSDYNKETTVKNLGFKNKEKAIYTINTIKSKPLKYQVSLVATMLGRAKSHPNRTTDMEDAIIIFQKWMDDYKLSKLK